MFVWSLRKSGRSILCVLIAMGICGIMLLSCRKRPEPAVSVSGDSAGPVLIIDAGHGGEDGGAVSADGLRESAVNLDIALRLRELARFLGVQTVMTRETEDLDYPGAAKTTAARKKWDTRQRVALANGVEGGVLISIHQNCYPTKGPHGSQVLYAGTEESKRLGELLHANLVQALDPENRRVAEPIRSSIYLMAHVKCPAVLVECGFLSNPQESGLLATDSYKLKIAAVTAASFLQYTEGPDESENSVLLYGVRQ